MENKLERSIGFDVATAVIVGVVAYSGYRIVQGEALSLEPYVHLSALAITFGVTFRILLLVQLRKRISHPLRDISNHVEDMSMGIFQQWEYSTHPSEMEGLTTVMNRVAARNNNLQINWRVLSFDLASHFTRLQGNENLPGTLQADLEETWDHLQRMDWAIMGAYGPSPHFVEPRTGQDGKASEIQSRRAQSISSRSLETSTPEDKEPISNEELTENIPRIPTVIPEAYA